MKVALTQTVTEGFPKGKLFSRNMAKCSNHYELAFESYLRDRRVAYVAVDEQRRSLVAQSSLKNLDFIVTPSDSVSLLVDIKGRRFPSGTRHKQYWRNWSTRDDLASMARWQDKMGPASCALFVFAYEIVGPRSPSSTHFAIVGTPSWQFA